MLQRKAVKSELHIIQLINNKMNRRDFIKTSLFAPFCIKHVLAGAETKFAKSTDKTFALLEVKGSYEQIGHQIGKVFGLNIRQIIQQRNKWHSKLTSILTTKKGRSVSQELLRLTKKHFPHILQSHNPDSRIECGEKTDLDKNFSFGQSVEYCRFADVRVSD